MYLSGPISNSGFYFYGCEQMNVFDKTEVSINLLYELVIIHI